MKPPAFLELEKRQRQLEEDAVDAGVKRYRRLLQRNSSSASRPGIEFLRRHFDALSKLISDEQCRICHPSVELEKYSVPLLCLHADKLAFISLHSIFNLLAMEENDDAQETGIRHTHLAWNIGRRIWDERRLEVFLRRERDLTLTIGKRYSDSIRSREVRRQTLDSDWSVDNRHIHVGAALIDLAARIPNVFVVEKQIERRGNKTKTIRIVRLTANSAKELRQRHEYLELLAPVHRPMLVPPRKWEGLRGGGYLRNGESQQIDLVKHWNNPSVRKVLDDANKNRQLDVAISAVNALQETPWRINKNVFDAMRTVLRHGKVDPLVADLQTKLQACRKMVYEHRFYFPYQLDYRGRAYPIPQTVHPQADDAGRALLEFADGKPLREDGIYWLAIHIANLFGYQVRRSWQPRCSDEIGSLSGTRND